MSVKSEVDSEFPNKWGLIADPIEGYVEIGGLSFWINENGAWAAWQQDRDNEYYCSFGENSGHAKGSWSLEEGQRVLRIDEESKLGAVGPLLVWDGAVALKRDGKWLVEDTEGRVFDFNEIRK